MVKGGSHHQNNTMRYDSTRKSVSNQKGATSGRPKTQDKGILPKEAAGGLVVPRRNNFAQLIQSMEDKTSRSQEAVER